MVTLPADFTCFVATDARLSRTFVTSFFFSSVSVAMASARPPLERTLPAAFMAFMAFMAFDFGAIVTRRLARRRHA